MNSRSDKNAVVYMVDVDDPDMTESTSASTRDHAMHFHDRRLNFTTS